MNYEVIPLKKIGPVFLGMLRKDVRSTLGIQPYVFRKGADSSSLSEAYHESCFQVFYDEDDRVEYIEVSSGGAAFVTVYGGKDVFETRASDLVDLVSKEAPFDSEHPELGYSYIFPRLELSLWRPAMPEDEQDPEGQYFSTIGIGKRGYYSERLRE
jgi:hypothetical protein